MAAGRNPPAVEARVLQHLTAIVAAQNRLDIAAKHYDSIRAESAVGSVFDEARITWKKAEKAWCDAASECHALRFQVAQCPATTMQGIMLKAHVFTCCLGSTPDEIDFELDDAIDDGSAESLAISIVKDLERLDGGRSSKRAATSL